MMITKFEIFEEIKYTTEHIQLIRKLRYLLNKNFKHGCGVSKIRTMDFGVASHVPSPYTGVILFNIFIRDLFYDDNNEKCINFKKIADEVGLIYDGFYDYAATEEQMKELIFKLKYIDYVGDTEKYNL